MGRPVEGEPGTLKVLLITQWFDPEPTFKGLLFAKELKRLGFSVSVLTGFPNYPGGKLYDGYRIRPFQREVVEGIPVLRVALYPSHDGSALRRILNYVSFAVSASVAGLFIRRPDLAYVYHPPATVGLPAFVLKLFRGVPYVYDVQDLWPDTLAASGMLTQSRLLQVMGILMKLIYRSAARVVVLSDGFREILATRGVSRRRIEVISNWADEAQINLHPSNDSNLAAAGFDGTFTVTFAGNLGTVQALHTVLDAADLLRDEPDLRFLIVGDGVESESLRRQTRARGLPNVSFLPRRPLSEIGEILSGSDVLLVHLRDDPLFSITIPSKTQAYLMAGRPILMGVRGDAARMIHDAGAGLVFEPENADQLVRAVLQLKGLSSHDRDVLGESGARYYRERLSLSVGAKRFGEVFEVARLSRPRFQAVKRLVDVVIATSGLILLGVPMAILSVLIRWRLGAPVLFRQMRPGRDGEPFQMIKFRTMTERWDGNGVPLPDAERLTGFGSLLRSTSLDEVPSLWNVLRGEMSLVGPRPLLLRYTEFFTAEESLRLTVKPGITGWAQINGRNTASWNERLASDVWYVRHMSARLDTKVFFRTITNVFARSGVVVDPESVMKNLDDERRASGATKCPES